MNKLKKRIQFLWVFYWFFLSVAIATTLSVIDSVWLGFIYPLGLPIFTLLMLTGIVHTLFRYRSWRFEVREDSLYLERGVLTKRYTIVPFSRLQHVDTQRSPLDRVMNLSTVVVYTAGSRGADVSIPGLEPEKATELQKDLKDKTMEFELGGEDAV